MSASNPKPHQGLSTTAKTTLRLGVWTALWLVSTALPAFGAKFLWDFSPGWSVAAIAVNLLIGIGVIRANITHLRGLDELQQRIQLEATAITLSLGVIVGIAYSLLDVTNLIGNNAEISFLIMFIGITYMTSLLLITRKYQ